MTVDLMGWLLCIVFSIASAGWVYGYWLETKIAALEAFTNAQQAHIAILHAENGIANALIDETLESNRKCIALNDRLLGMAVKDLYATRSAIVPPPGGMVA
jgi:hypothetical protein